MSNNVEAVIVGAGPYGLSIGAHLRFHGVNFRIFGSPLSVWRNHMPEGMHLKSDGFASNLSDPQSTFTLKHYCQQSGIPYDDMAIPVRLETFIAYGEAFQRVKVPSLENVQVTAITRQSDAFEIRLSTGEKISTGRVVIATGISHFPYIPPILHSVGIKHISHSYDHSNVDGFREKNVVVVGGGASAMDMAALLYERGANVSVLARARNIRFNERRADVRTTFERLRHPDSGVGPSLQGWFYCRYPHIFRRLPRNARVRIVRRFLGPAAGWTVRDRILGKVPILAGTRIEEASEGNGCVRLRLSSDASGTKEIETEHVIAATGYRVDLQKLAFLSEDLQSQIVTDAGSPVLSNNFQSTLPGLYFAGLAGAYSFGPLLRFACGADFAARRISHHLVRALQRKSSPARRQSENPVTI